MALNILPMELSVCQDDHESPGQACLEVPRSLCRAGILRCSDQGCGVVRLRTDSNPLHTSPVPMTLLSLGIVVFFFPLRQSICQMLKFKHRKRKEKNFVFTPHIPLVREIEAYSYLY